MIQTLKFLELFHQTKVLKYHRYQHYIVVFEGVFGKGWRCLGKTAVSFWFVPDLLLILGIRFFTLVLGRFLYIILQVLNILMPPDTKFIQVHLFPKAYFCRLNGQTGRVNNSELFLERYTLEDSHGTQKWRFGRWFSFSIGWFLGSKC